MIEQKTMTKFAAMCSEVRASMLALERSRVNFEYTNETYTDSMLALQEQYRKIKHYSDDTSAERDDNIAQLEKMSKLASAYRLHTHDHNVALFRLRHSASALTVLLQHAKTTLTDNSPLNQTYEELELRSLIRRAEAIHFRY